MPGNQSPRAVLVASAIRCESVQIGRQMAGPIEVAGDMAEVINKLVRTCHGDL
jgi:hypothetical protein